MSVAPLFSGRKRVADVAREMRCPFQTVYSWKTKDAVPAWRRPAVLDAVRRLRIELPAEVIAYLAKAD